MLKESDTGKRAAGGALAQHLTAGLCRCVQPLSATGEDTEMLQFRERGEVTEREGR